MMRIATASVVALSLVALAATAAADHHEGSQAPAVAAPATRIKELGVAELVKLRSGREVAVFDANSAETRAKYGVIPGAVLLDSSSQYDTSALPSDKTQLLVFYCANTRCTASDKAAQRAREAGWANVAVFRAGIAGWVEAGKATSSVDKAKG